MRTSHSKSIIAIILSLSLLRSPDASAYCGDSSPVTSGNLSNKEQRVAFIEAWIRQDKSVKEKIPTLSSDEEQLLLTPTSSLRESRSLEQRRIQKSSG